MFPADWLAPLAALRCSLTPVPSGPRRSLRLQTHGSRNPTSPSPRHRAGRPRPHRRPRGRRRDRSRAWSPRAPTPTPWSPTRIEIGARVLDREQTGANAEFVKTEFEKVSQERRGRVRRAAQGHGRGAGPASSTTCSTPRAATCPSRSTSCSPTAAPRPCRTASRSWWPRRSSARARTCSSSSPPATASNPLADFKTRTVDAIKRGRRAPAQDPAGPARADERAREAAPGPARREAEARGAGRRARARHREGPHLRGGGRRGRRRDRRRARRRGRGRRRRDAAPAGARATCWSGIDGCTGPPRGRIVFEAKDKPLSKPQFYSRARRARWSSATPTTRCSWCPAPDEVPARLHSLREYQGDKMIAVFDPEEGSTLELEFAYRVARARVTAAREGADEIDAGGHPRHGRPRASPPWTTSARSSRSSPRAQTGIGAARDLLEGDRGPRARRARRRSTTRWRRATRSRQSGAALPCRSRSLGQQQRGRWHELVVAQGRPMSSSAGGISFSTAALGAGAHLVVARRQRLLDRGRVLRLDPGPTVSSTEVPSSVTVWASSVWLEIVITNGPAPLVRRRDASRPRSGSRPSARSDAAGRGSFSKSSPPQPATSTAVPQQQPLPPRRASSLAPSSLGAPP